MSNVATRALLVATACVYALAGVHRSHATRATGPVPPETTEGRLATRDGKRVVDVPLEHTEVTIRVAGHLADVTVEQRFRNPYDHKIEAVYLFPLPTGAAVNDLEIEVGDRVVKGEIAKRDEAKATYVKAKKAGFVAALLTQERPNLFTQHVANLEPGARVVVRMRYLEPLRYEGGGYELVFPMVAGPRHVPATSGQAADAAAVQPAVLPPTVRSSHELGVTVELDAGVPLRGVRSTSHAIVQSMGTSQAQTRVTLAAGATIPNQDFVLRYDVAGEAPAVAVMAHRAGDAPGAFFLTLHPPADAAAAAVAPRELVFVIDTSSSMRGAPLAKARALVRGMLATLGADDTFQIVRFADSTSALGERPIANKPKNLEYALAWLDGLEAGGGTAMTAGIAAALDFPHDPARLRLTVFVTDGYVGNEDEILATVHAKLGTSRLYSFGVGTAVNRYLLEEMASFGRGAVQVVRPDEDTAAAVAKFHDRLARPVLTDVAIDWGGLAVADVTPAAIPDLFVGQPIVVAGHYAQAGAATVTVRGRAGGRDVRFAVPVELPAVAARPAIATVWARARIAELTRAEIRGATAATRDEITSIALAHRLMSRYTAFVAVDRSRTTAGGDAKPVAVPVEVPAGLHATGGTGVGMMSGVAVGYGSGGAGMGMASVSSGYGSVSQHIAVTPMVKLSAPVRAAPAPVPDLSSADAASPGAPIAALRGDAPRVAEDRVTVGGSDLRGLRLHELGKHKLAARKLLAARLAASPAAAGSYTLRLTIAASGAVTGVEVTRRPSGDGVDAIAASLTAAAYAWKLTPASAEVSINTTVVLAVIP